MSSRFPSAARTAPQSVAAYPLDSFDRRILELVQRQGDIGPAELSCQIHLSPSQCSRRLQRLRTEGYVDTVVALLSPKKLNLGIKVCLLVKLRSISPEVERNFADRVMSLSEVVSADYLAGQSDFVLEIQTRDVESYASFLSERLLPGLEIESLYSSFVLKPIKMGTELPLNYC